MGEQPVTTGSAGAGNVEVRTADDGSVIVLLRGVVGPECAVELRQLLVRTVRRVRPLRLVVDLTEVVTLDPINVGTLAAACFLGDDHQVAVFLTNPKPELAVRLSLAGVPPQRLCRED
ncbi:STAS domain-containing protein [Actinoplanes sp. M2I2]|uniref:STAS domain-containing protein n=1 Tax=Actinoplanes sp. M2I2 TaxID=1734444 RepID=UPI0020218BE4|nr:STAS domain-containing protein [Actinoplanes sp. M2I2]